MTYRKKLIEVSLPLEAINKASAREKSIRHGNISTLHLYWARRPLASCRAVLFGMLVDDPSSVSEEFPTVEEQAIERDRLHRLLEKLVIWRNLNDDSLLHQARWEIARSIGRSKGIEPPTELNPNEHLGVHDNKKKRNALIDWLHEHGPLIHDPFCGGGAIPLEAQRLGLRTMGTDLNPLAVMITKATTEIPAKFADMPPINPEAKKNGRTNWRGAEGLAEDVRYYGEWMRQKAWESIGHHYPNVTITEKMVVERPDLKKYLNKELTPIAWIWARTVRSPDPAYSSCHVPLIKSRVLSRKPNQQHWVEIIDNSVGVDFVVRRGEFPSDEQKGTVSRSGATCFLSKNPITFDYIRSEAKKGRMSSKLMAIVLNGDNERVFVSPNNFHTSCAEIETPPTMPSGLIKGKSKVNVGLYGFSDFQQLFTNRQGNMLITFCNLLNELNVQIRSENEEGDIELSTKRGDYIDAIRLFLSIGINKLADRASTICTWDSSPKQLSLRNTFGRQAIPMTWDYAEGNAFSKSSGNWLACLEWGCKVLKSVPATGSVDVHQLDASTINHPNGSVLYCTDPPYYDNIAYADLSDFFYIWMKHNMSKSYPDIFTTILTPKEGELVATPYLHDSKKDAEEFFLNGMKDVIGRMATQNNPESPVCFFYAFKQQESGTDGTSSTGWSTFLEATISSGFNIVGTIPMRTEQSNKLLGKNANILSTSAVLVCRQRTEDAPTARRTEFLRELRQELEPAMKDLQEGGISPVDLAQAAIGPGIGVFSKYSAILEADGSHMSVRRALEIINEELSVILGETDDEIDAESRVCLRWFASFGEDARVYGELDSLLRSINASPDKIEKSGCMIFGDGKVRIAEIESYPGSFNAKDAIGAPAWAHVHRLIRLLDVKGESEAVAYMRYMPSHQRDSVRSLTYRLYQICEEKKMMEQAKSYNTLAISWGQVADRSQKPAVSTQATLNEY
jgi:putative DNA methylase